MLAWVDLITRKRPRGETHLILLLLFLLGLGLGHCDS